MIVNKACKCYKCKVSLNVGDKGEFLKLTVDSHKHVAMTHFRGWAVVCADESACNSRIAATFTAKDLAQKSVDAQATIDALRNTPGTPEAVISAVMGGFKGLGLSVK